VPSCPGHDASIECLLVTPFVSFVSSLSVVGSFSLQDLLEIRSSQNISLDDDDDDDKLTSLFERRQRTPTDNDKDATSK